MIDIDPQQEIFTAVKLAIGNKGYRTYDGALPSLDTPYPFVYLGECSQTDTQNKSALFGTVSLTIHVWSNKPNKRGTLSAIMLDVKDACRNITSTKNFRWYVSGVYQRVLPDNSTETPLLHGVLDVEFKFN